MKKLISVLLIVAMMLSLGVTVSFAEGETAAPEAPQAHLTVPAGATEVTFDDITYTVIRTVDQLAAEKAAGNYILANDIDCGGKTYTATPFVFAEGSLLEGNGYTVSNLNTSNATGVFQFGKGATVRNLTVGTAQNHVIIASSANTWVGTFDASGDLLFENVIAYSDVTATGTSSGTSTAGGMVGWGGGKQQYINCMHEGTVTGAKDVGGWIGFVNSGSVTLTGCVSNGTVTAKTSNNAGGFIGCTNNTPVNATSCINNANVTGTNRLGGFVAYSTGNDVFVNCTNRGNVSSTQTTNADSQNVGGFTGRVDKKQTYSNCVNEGTVNANNRTGGFIGWAALASADMTECTNRGNIGNTTVAENIGGLIGTNENVANIVNCYNYGTVMGAKYAGGFVGRISWNNTGKANITSSYNYGTVRGGADMGGFLGYQSVGSLGAVITNCINYGSLIASGNAAGFIGESNAAEIKGCINLGSVTNSGWGSIAGYIGWADNVTIDACANLGQISSTSTGGARIANFVGGGNCAAIKNCYAFGNVTVFAENGGILVGGNGFKITTAEGNKYFAVANAVSTVGTDATGLTSQADALALLNAGFAPYSFMLNQNAQIVIANPVLKAVQETVADRNNQQKIRFIATVEATNYKMIGFKVKTQVAGEEMKTRDDQYCTCLFNSIKATENGNTVAYSAEKLFGSYIYALSINQVPTDRGNVTFEITPFAIGADDAEYLGIAFTVVYCNGEFVSATAA